MNLELYELVSKLKDEIKDSFEYKEAIRLSKLIEEDDNCKLLAYKKDMKIVELEDSLKLNDRNSIQVLKIQNELKDIIDELNNIDLVKEYNKYIKELEKMNKYLNDSIFGVIDEN